MKLAITGGAGFIGSNLADELLARGDDVLILDDLSTGQSESLPPRAAFRQLDVSGPTEILADALRGRDVVFHLAALARVPRSITDPLATHRANVTGTLNVLKAASDVGVARVVYASSSSVYGDQPALPLTEEMTPNPLNPYAAQKLMGEIYCGIFRRVYGLPSVCLRYFNVFGPRQAREGPYRLVIGIFLEQRARGQPLTIHGDGEQTRDFTYVSDVVRATIAAAEVSSVGDAEAINVGSGRETSINRIAELIGGPVVHLAPRGNDERYKRADITRAKRLLGWEPTTSIEEGLARL